MGICLSLWWKLIQTFNYIITFSNYVALMCWLPRIFISASSLLILLVIIVSCHKVLDIICLLPHSPSMSVNAFLIKMESYYACECFCSLHMIIISSFVVILQNFLFGGRLILGPDAWSLPFTLLLIITPVTLFSVFVVTHLRHEFLPSNAGNAILVIAILFTLLVSLLQCSFDTPFLMSCFSSLPLTCILWCSLLCSSLYVL